MARPMLMNADKVLIQNVVLSGCSYMITQSRLVLYAVLTPILHCAAISLMLSTVQFGSAVR